MWPCVEAGQTHNAPVLHTHSPQKLWSVSSIVSLTCVVNPSSCVPETFRKILICWTLYDSTRHPANLTKRPMRSVRAPPLNRSCLFSNREKPRVRNGRTLNVSLHFKSKQGTVVLQDKSKLLFIHLFYTTLFVDLCVHACPHCQSPEACWPFKWSF